MSKKCYKIFVCIYYVYYAKKMNQIFVYIYIYYICYAKNINENKLKDKRYKKYQIFKYMCINILNFVC